MSKHVALSRARLLVRTALLLVVGHGVEQLTEAEMRVAVVDANERGGVRVEDVRRGGERRRRRPARLAADLLGDRQAEGDVW